LTAGQHLEFRDIQLTNPKSAVFVFDDTHQRGRELERDFSKGALVSAIDFHTQLRALRGALNNAISAANSGVTELKFKGTQNVRSATQR
jgi:hypothetical protein